MQRKQDNGPYRFRRTTANPSDTAGYDGYGMPVRPTGLIASVFRPSGDGCVFPFLIPSNMMAVVVLRQLADLAQSLRERDMADDARRLAAEVDAALLAHAVVDHPRHGRVFAYEVDGFGGRLVCDDANAPSLLSMPYFGWRGANDPIYRATRAMVLSEDNPWFFLGRTGDGVGSPHTGYRRIWPIAIVMRALTSRDDREILTALRQLLATDAGTGFMHEAFDVDDPARFSRPWFAWANTVFGELVLNIAVERPKLLAQL